MAEERRALTMATGVCMIVRTADKQLLVQYRTAKNALYSEILGASIAGMFDAKLPAKYAETVADRHTRMITNREARQQSITDAQMYSGGLLGEITEESILAQIKAEAREELGLMDNLSDTKVLGIAEDLIKPGHAIVMLGNVRLTASQIAQTASSQYEADKDKFDIPEWCVGIPATGEAVAVLLSKVCSPLAPTHAAAFLLAGKALVLEQKGTDAAEAWEAETVAAYTANLDKINRICRAHTESSYDPKKKAIAEQGLGSPIQLLKEELNKAGLALTTA